MTDWAEPQNITDWLKRLFSPHSLLLTFLVAGIAVSEVRFDWAEQLIGTYLTTTNPYRPESGAIWETGKKAFKARQSLEQIVTDLEDSRRNALQAESFSEIITKTKPGKWAMLSPEHFRKLYLQIPENALDEIIPTVELLSHITSGRWTRTYIDKSGENLRIYFLDSKNRVVRRIAITANRLMEMEREKERQAKSLDGIPEFENRIYPASAFFSALTSVPADTSQEILARPAQLLDQPGRLTRVGISDVTSEGLIRLGFEFERGGKTRILFLTGGDMAVWYLRNKLEGKGEEL